MPKDCPFCHIAKGLAHADIVFEDEQVMAFAEAIAPDPDTLATLRSTLEKLTSTYLQAAEKASA
ncbi:MAG: hypothetical protein AAFR02_05635, partial [Pseudomonadota bacterium]